MSLSIAALALAGAAASTAVFRSWRSKWAGQVGTWAAVAQRYGLQLRNAGEPHDAALSGEFRGVPIEVTLGGGHAGRPLQMCTRVFARHVGSVPPGIEICNRGVPTGVPAGAPEISTGNEALDAMLILRGLDEDKTLEVVGNAKIWADLAALFELADYVRVDERGVLLENIGVLSGAEVEAWLQAAARFSVAMCEAYEDAWHSFARRLGLGYHGAGKPGERLIRGHYRGGRISLRTGLDPRTHQPRSTIKVALQAGLPAGFRIGRKGQIGDYGIIPIQDKQLADVIQVQGTNRIAIQRMIRHPGLKEKLLAFFAACPDPVVEHGWVCATGPGLLTGDIQKQVDAVVDMSAALTEAWEPVAKAIERSRRPTARTG